jgi:hypothetical protein
MNTDRGEVSTGIAAIRWLARGFGLLISGFLLFIFIGETGEGHLRNPQGSFPGNVSGGFSPKGVLNPILLCFWLPVLLYLLCWGLEGKQTRELISR